MDRTTIPAGKRNKFRMSFGHRRRGVIGSVLLAEVMTVAAILTGVVALLSTLFDHVAVEAVQIEGVDVPARPLRLSPAIATAALNREGELLLLAYPLGECRCLHVDSGRFSTVWELAEEQVTAIAAAPACAGFLVGTQRGSLLAVTPQSTTADETRVHADFSPAGPRGAFAFEVSALSCPQLGAIEHIVLSRDGRKLAYATRQGHVVCWDLEQHRLVHADTIPRVSIQTLEFFPGGDFLALGCGDGRVVVYSLRNSRLHAVWKEDVTPISCLSATPDGQQLLIGTAAGQVICWNVHNDAVCWASQAQRGTITVLSVSSCSDGIRVAHMGGPLLEMNRLTGQLRHELAQHPVGIRNVLSSDTAGKQFVVGYDGRIVMWDAAFQTSKVLLGP